MIVSTGLGDDGWIFSAGWGISYGYSTEEFDYDSKQKWREKHTRKLIW